MHILALKILKAAVAVTSSWLHGKIQGLVMDRSEKEKLLAGCFNEDLVISSLSRFICKLCEHRMIRVEDPWELATSRSQGPIELAMKQSL